MRYLTNREIDDLSINDLSKTLRELNAEANKRIGVLKDENLKTMSIALRETLPSNKVKFTVPKNARPSQLKSEILNVQKFLRSPTSRPAGVKEGLKEFKEDYKGSVKDYERYVRNYPAIEQAAQSLGIHIDSDIIVKIIEIAKSSNSRKTAIERFNDFIQSEYEKADKPMSERFIEV